MTLSKQNLLTNSCLVGELKSLIAVCHTNSVIYFATSLQGRRGLLTFNFLTKSQIIEVFLHLPKKIKALIVRGFQNGGRSHVLCQTILLFKRQDRKAET